MYQFLINAEDEKVIDYLKFLTFLSKEEIEKIENEHLKYPEKRLAHKTLAHEVISFIHGEEAYLEAVKITESLFQGNISSLSAFEIEEAFKGLVRQEMKEEMNIVDFLVVNNICSSKREAREFLDNGSIYLNGERIKDKDLQITRKEALYEKYLIIRRGKKKYFIVVFV